MEKRINGKRTGSKVKRNSLLFPSSQFYIWLMVLAALVFFLFKFFYPESLIEKNLMLSESGRGAPLLPRQMGQWLFLLSILGFAVMAVIQVLKEVFPLRRGFQRNWFNKWLRQRMSAIENQQGTGTLDFPGKYRRIIDLAMSGDEGAFFDLPLEQMTSQLNAALQIALDYPRKHYSLLKIFAPGVESDLLTIRCFTPDMRSQKEPEEKFQDARNRASGQIQRTIDTIQISLKSSWRRYVQVMAFVMSILTVFLGLASSIGIRAFSPEMIVRALAAAFLAGFAATVFRDLLSLLQRSRE